MSDEFYLGRIYDLAKGKLTTKPLLYDPADLTTHALVTGMTGSGKTGLCIALLEEAALQGIPALLIDPKGDLTNLLLHFPDLAPQELQPWLDPEMARRAGKTIEKVAADAAQAWQKGLAEWGIGRDRIQALATAVQYAIYTPGSDAGIPVSVLSSLQVPSIPWEDNLEVLRENITSTVTAILGLVGFTEVDPLRSREHILLANIFEVSWSQGRDLDLTELILQIQSPPFEKLGAFPVETFFPKDDRMKLALQINNILAAPAFELWRIGHPLDIGALLFMPDGKPRHSVFYLAHLSDTERMFFITLLLSAVETWMRTQSGVTSLRAILYFDEIFGYLPPTAIPPSKPPMLRMLKQARAFGLGLLLATQNPVDVDYKGLANAGTWFIGKLQTDQDKQRLLDGLQSADGSLNRRAYDSLISKLGKRTFLMHNVHQKQDAIFQSRWVMNFLAGPLTRVQIPTLNKLVGADVLAKTLPRAKTTRPAARPAPESPRRGAAAEERAASAAPVPAGRSKDVTGSQTKPTLPSAVEEYILPLNLSLTEAILASGQPVPSEASMSGVLYRPGLVASALVRFLDRKRDVDSEIYRSALVVAPDRRGMVRWDDHLAKLPEASKMDATPAPQARFMSLDAPLSDAKILTALEKDFTDWVYRTSKLTLRAHEELGLYATPDVSHAEFIKVCSEAARQARDEEISKATASIDRQIATLQGKLSREQRELRQDETELQQRKIEEMGTHAENVLGLFTGRRSSRRLTTSLTKRRLTEQAKMDVEESQDVIVEYQKQLAELEQGRSTVVEEIQARWGDVANDITEISLTPKKSDIFVDLFGVAWVPYYLVKSGKQIVEILAFGQES